ncbi:Tol-Pal system protein TolB [Helicobacter canis]|uniref:Tol-Pal system beta propeller repeat protein TolB n=1 Tax=Helicobacter canis NCTC 12740 TaxID=1357399 RepID=V8CIK2_9HELI|nr:Tol-Pal system protein TolB [Helicobacter canis]ETD26855.1 tol-Pal system beta propeller repeat protein TolB [Helicobacter canis NCTC 12740]
MRSFLLIVSLMCGLFGADATIDIVKSGQKTPKIEIGYISSGESLLAKKIYKILLGDLNVSGHFEPTDGAIYAKDSIDFSAYQAKKIDLVAIVQVIKENKILKATILVYDSNSSALKINKTYQLSDSTLYPFVAHKMAIDINAYIKAPTIAWMNRYVIYSQYTGSGRANIVLSDYTLTYNRTIVTGGLNIFPKWADSTQQEFYFTKYLVRPTIIKYNIHSGRSEQIIDSDGMAAVSDVSRDGQNLLITLAPKHQPDIYLYNVASKEISQLTKYSGIDVSGYFIDNERSMVFVSDRSGYANIYSKKLDIDAPAEQVVYHGRNNNSITAYRDYVAYSSRESDNEFGANTFNIYLISTKTDYIRRLTAIGNNQMPRFSKDGGSVMFLKHTSGQTALGVIRLDYNKSYLFPLNKANIQSFDW